MAGPSAQQCTHKAQLLPEEKAHFEAGRRACSSRLWTGLHSEGNCLSSNLTRLYLCASDCKLGKDTHTHTDIYAQIRAFNSREGSWLPAMCIVCMSESGLKSYCATMYVNDQCINLHVRVQACVYDISMATKFPSLPLGTRCWQRETADRGSFVCVWLKY